MRIVLITSAFPPKWLGGTEIATCNIANHLVKRGHEVHILTARDEGMPKTTIDGKLYVTRIDKRSIKIIGVFEFWLNLFLAIRKINPDIVHSQGIMIYIPAFLSKLILKKPTVLWGRGSDVYSSWRFKKEILRVILSNTNAIIALTGDMRDAMCQLVSKDIVIIPNGINFEKIKYKIVGFPKDPNK